ncbi:MAG: hypothetical protein K1X83_06400 [Oligoflexia bacterium]|nr:hypothetical protein [Oligoflexia bacterium]
MGGPTRELSPAAKYLKLKLMDGSIDADGAETIRTCLELQRSGTAHDEIMDVARSLLTGDQVEIAAECLRRQANSPETPDSAGALVKAAEFTRSLPVPRSLDGISEVYGVERAALMRIAETNPGIPAYHLGEICHVGHRNQADIVSEAGLTGHVAHVDAILESMGVPYRTTDALAGVVAESQPTGAIANDASDTTTQGDAESESQALVRTVREAVGSEPTTAIEPERVEALNTAISVMSELYELLEALPEEKNWTLERLIELYTMTQSEAAVGAFAEKLSADGFTNEQLGLIWKAAHESEVELPNFLADLLSGDQEAKARLGLQVVKGPADLEPTEDL